MSGITFSETMRGPFDLNSSKPENGAKAGRENNTELVFRAAITIPDLDQFIADPNHRADLAGEIQHPQTGEIIRGRTGSFNLFQPGDERGQKKMVYEMPFEMDGTDYRFVGTKIVQNNAGYDLWSDTTTLYTVLYRSAVANENIAGAGILRLGLREQIALLQTLRAIQAKYTAEKVGKVAQFLGFFLGELAKTYLGPSGHRPKMVGWYRPTLLMRAASEAVISTIFGQYADQRLLQAIGLGPACKFDYSVTERKTTPIYAPVTLSILASTVDSSAAEEQQQREEIWFDYIADTGDGWNPTYTVARLATQPELTLVNPSSDAEIQTQAGDVVVFGGDQVYPSASLVDYEERLVEPFRAAFGHRMDAEYPDVYAIPGNHDWYDGLVTFSRLFCSDEPFAGPLRNGKMIKDIGCETPQNRSYFVLKLPHGWWLFGTDVQLGHDIDGPQLSFFRTVSKKIPIQDRIILMVAEPYWIDLKREEKRVGPEQHTALDTLEEILGDRIAVFIAGDIHHYRRYEANDNSMVQKITAGGGGAFLHPTHGPWPQSISDKRPDGEAGHAKQFECRKSFPDAGLSRRLGWRNFLFPFLNPKFGVLTALVYFIFAWMLLPASERYSDMRAKEYIAKLNKDAKKENKNIHYEMPDLLGPDRTTNIFRKSIQIQRVTDDKPENKHLRRDGFPFNRKVSGENVERESVPFDYAAAPWQMAYGILCYELTIPDPFQSLLFLGFTIAVGLGIIYFTDIARKWQRALFGGFHFMFHYLVFFLLFWLGLWLMAQIAPVTVTPGDSGIVNTDDSLKGLRVWAVSAIVFVGGWFFGSLVMGTYFYIALNWFRRHWNEAFSSLRIEDYKHFLRFHIDKEGALNIYPIGVERVAKKWRIVPETYGPHIEPEEPIEHQLIENPIRITK